AAQAPQVVAYQSVRPGVAPSGRVSSGTSFSSTPREHADSASEPPIVKPALFKNQRRSRAPPSGSASTPAISSGVAWNSEAGLASMAADRSRSSGPRQYRLVGSLVIGGLRRAGQ